MTYMTQVDLASPDGTTHTYRADDESEDGGMALCGHDDADNCADPYDGAIDAPPTCQKCLALDPRFA